MMIFEAEDLDKDNCISYEDYFPLLNLFFKHKLQDGCISIDAWE